jgi:hypothetical protein
MAKALTTCFCGCGGTTKSRFVPGHDAKFHSVVKQCIRGLLDPTETRDALPHDAARQEFDDYAAKILPREVARQEAEEAKAKAKADKLAAKATPVVEAVQETVSADQTLVA